MSSRYPRMYRRLKAAGFSALYAERILLDAHRGDDNAMRWVRIAFYGRR